MPKEKWFKDSPSGIQLHAGSHKKDTFAHSDDGGKTWWSATFFKGTRKELEALAVSILRDLPTAVVSKQTGEKYAD